ncbi:MAG: hypothetical protein A4E27_01658 [Methanobacterium sp. PtaU1.Bin242]|nr:MAG: hypothetical protein A4E27_01658 [Methanobacterium sp. PtaU1.Bin242]
MEVSAAWISIQNIDPSLSLGIKSEEIKNQGEIRYDLEKKVGNFEIREIKISLDQIEIHLHDGEEKIIEVYPTKFTKYTYSPLKKKSASFSLLE